jgi:hypothetical protein
MKRYEPVWAMIKKIRNAMGQRDQRYGLSDMIELDDGFFPHASCNNKKIKRGKGSQKMKNVAVMTESITLEDLVTGKKSSQWRFFKMKVLYTKKEHSINETVQESLDKKTTVLSDKRKNYVDIADYIEAHVTVVSDKHSTNTALRWVCTAISNAKRTLIGIYHLVKGCNLQLYLDEFCYKLNRRYFGNGIFDRIAVAIASSNSIQAD